MMLRDYKMFTYRIRYTVSGLVRDFDGDLTDETFTKNEDFEHNIVAENETLANAWMEQQHNPSYLSCKDFSKELVNTQPAPHILVEMHW